MNCRERQEIEERRLLSPYAMHVLDTKGRLFPEEPCEIRTDYVRDRDRILHCKSFRRMKHKTQVFLSPQGDHYRTRLTHTLEVSQIARTISRALRLNEDLTEAIALGHDLGHTPFGHCGENMLNSLLKDGFSHNLQSLRVVDHLEKGGKGLNLTFEVRDGIAEHKRSGHPCTLEGEVVSFSDRIAYINHDIDDAIRGGILKESDLPKECTDLLGHSHSKRINSMILDIVRCSTDRDHISMSPSHYEAFDRMRDFMFDNVYRNPTAKGEEGKAMRVVEQLFRHYMAHLEELPAEFLVHLERDGAERICADYIACMSDTYAIADFERLFVPKLWA